MELKAGTVNAIVGPSGSGKSTIAKLIASLWDVDSGSIKIGGVDVKEMSLADFNRKIAYVAQDNYLFNETVRENIRQGNPEATDEQIIEVTKKSGCYEFIMQLENGFDTVVGGAGGHLSGGERQRISIARAMLKDAPIVILDEATAYTNRTYNMKSPYPEEFNRQAIGLTASLHFAPTQKAADALLKEGKDPERIFITGNTGIDALHYTVRSDFYHPETEWAKGSRLIAVTAHKRENLGEPMRDMFRAIRRIVEEFADVKVIYPVHLNPQVRKIADEEFGGCERKHLIEPLDVVEFHNLMKASYLIMTDSGGIQEEAPALGKPVLVMRDTTERPEGVEAGTLKLVGTKMDDIYRECKLLLTEPETYRKMSEARNPYGDGTASIKIRKILEDIDA